MVICDNCVLPISGDDRVVISRPSLADPFGEEDWCPECSKAFAGFYRNAKAKHMTLAREEADALIKAWTRGKLV